MMGDTVREINRLNNEVGDLTNDAVLLRVAALINTNMTEATANHETLKERIWRLTKPDLVKLLAGLDGNNGQVKADNLKKVLFKEGLNAVRSKEDQAKGLKEAMVAVTKFLLAASYSSDDDPSISWSTLKAHVLKAKEDLDKETGRAEARAEAARAAAAAADDGMGA